MKPRAHSQPLPAVERELARTPLLAGLLAAGTTHVYGDTADVEELLGVAAVDERSLRLEIDGNTANQPLMRKVVDRVLDALAGDEDWQPLAAQRGELEERELLPRLYHLLLARVGNDMLRALAAGRRWEASLQLHMGLREDPAGLVAAGRELRGRVPTALVKIPFTPDAPHCLLAARALERRGVPVNVTSTFSARQAVVAALIAKATRTNVFMGRLNDGLRAELLGEHTVLEAQRALQDLRLRHGVHTHLIAASLRDWRSLPRIAGVDAMTLPCEVIADFLEQREVQPDQLESRVGQGYQGYEAELGVAEAVRERLGDERIARLYRVEPELIEFLVQLAGKLDGLEEGDAGTLDGDALRARFETAGFGDLFHAPDGAGREELARGKLPELDGALIERIPLDTHYSLLANADFDRHQEAIDEAVRERLAAG